jgi:hypothetical protein
MLGEAVHGTPTERLADMLGIASVISNRATLGNVAPEDVISAPGQFDAYGKALPDGVEQYRGLATQAWGQVQTIGPVTAATYYSTPAAAKNLPGGLQPVDQTTGHVYQVDPLNRSFATAKGFVQPAADLVANVAQKASQTARAIASGAVNAVGNAVEAVRGPGMAALAPNGLVSPGGLQAGGLSFRHPEQATIAAPMRDALTGLSAEFGQPVDVTSGYRSPSYNRAVKGAKNSLHTQGLAADIDMAGWSPEQRQKAVQELSQRGVGGFITYSGMPDTLHVDMRQRPNGVSPHFMHNKTAAQMGKAPGWFQESAEFGGLVTPKEMAAPRANPGTVASEYAKAAQTTQEAGVRGIGTQGNQTYGAPVGKVERASLGPAKAGPSGIIDNMRAGMESPTYGPGQVAPASAPSKPSPARPDNMMAAGPKGNFSVPSKPSAPTTADLANAYGQMATMGQVGIANLSGAPLSAPQKPSLAEVATAALPSTPAPAMPTPKTVKTQTIAAPQKKAAPQQTVAAPQTTIGAFPEAPTAPKSKVPSRVAGAVLGGLLGGLPGAAIGGLLGPSAMKSNSLGGLGSLFGGPANPQRSNYGSGLAAISDILGGGGTPGATAYSRSTPGYSVQNLGNGMIAKTNQYGVTSYEYTGPTQSLFGGGGMFGGGGYDRDRAEGISPGAAGAIDRGGSRGPAGLY